MGGKARNRSRNASLKYPSPLPSPLSLKTRDPNIRAIIIDEYEHSGSRFVRARYGVAPRTVREWKANRRSRGSLSPLPHRGGRPLALLPREQQSLESKLLRNPDATNKQLAHAVGYRITSRSAGNYVKRSPLHFGRKLEALDDEGTFTREHAEEGIYFINRLKRIPLRDRVYVDETATSAGLRRRLVRVPRGTMAWRPRNRKYPRYTVISALSTDGLLHKSRVYNKGSLTTEEFVHYVERHLAPRLRPGQVVLWDRWGRSGRAKFPQAHHWSPKARELIEARGARVVMLPPHGKFFDPLELIFGDIKRTADQRFRRKFKNVEPSKVGFCNLKSNWRHAERKLPAASIARAFTKRANGRDFIEVCTQKGLLD